ncbi:MAG TPA: hypothetical protein VK034_18220 [Enhygromyxa sp.]|nr:hypothetical protein [Enhygromyxa sp.]
MNDNQQVTKPKTLKLNKQSVGRIGASSPSTALSNPTTPMSQLKYSVCCCG